MSARIPFPLTGSSGGGSTGASLALDDGSHQAQLTNSSLGADGRVALRNSSNGLQTGRLILAELLHDDALGSPHWFFDTLGLKFQSAGQVAWTNGGNAAGTRDTYLSRGGEGTLEVGSSTGAKNGHFVASRFGGPARSSDPSNPPNGEWVIWQSDGTGTGDDGDVLLKITDSAGTTKTITLVDFSAS